MRTQLWRQINDLRAEGLGIRAIAKRLGMHRRTVRAALNTDRPPARSGASRGSVGLGKTHLAAALARHACMQRLPVLFTSAVDIVNHLTEARARNSLSAAVKKYTRPKLLIIDELGYLPLDKVGAELLFQVFCARYETASTVITTNRPYKEWAKTFANDATITSAVLDRIAHHCETVLIEGRSYRMKGRIEQPENN